MSDTPRTDAMMESARAVSWQASYGKAVELARSLEREKALHNPQFLHVSIRKSDGSSKRLTGYPMKHSECCVFKSKFSAEEQSRMLLEPVSGDPDHGPMGNQEAVLLTEINRLKTENQLLIAKLSRMCGDA